MNDKIKPRTVYLLRRTDKENDGTEIYVGSTSLPLKHRLCVHKNDIERCNSKLYTRMQKVGKHKWEIIPLLSRICDKNTIRKLEKKWCDLLNADLNSNSPFPDFDSKSKEYFANYRKLNKEKIKQQMVKYYHENIQNKIHHCSVCDRSFRNNYDLQGHLVSLNHSYAYLNSLD